MEQHVELDLNVREFDCQVCVYADVELDYPNSIYVGITEIRNHRNEKISDRLFNILMDVYEDEITEAIIDLNR